VRTFSPWELLDAVGNPNHWLHDFLDGADVFHLNGHWRPENYLFTRLCRRKGIPYVMHPRGMFLVGHRKAALKRLFNLLIGNEMASHAAKVIALSQYEVRQFRPYPIASERIEVVPNGIPLPGDAGKAVAQTEARYFLYIGRLESRKNLLFLVEAFADYVRAGGKSLLYLVGPVEHGYDLRIHEKVRELKLGKQVMICPPAYDAEKWKFLRNACAVIYPTVDEPYGRVPFEAVAAGTFPIIPDESGSAEYLSGFFPYCIYKHQNPASLVAVMRETEKRSEASDRGDLAKARAWVADTLDWKRIADRVVAIYREIAPARPELYRASGR
jgi:glycosyltransferase involved in cell wall biosynthesis